MARKNKEAEKEYQAEYYQENKGKRKTHTSSEVISRYQKRVYEKYSFVLRKDEDADLIEMINKEKENGLGTSEAIKKIMRKK